MSRIVYPAGPATKAGCYHIRKGDLPMVSLQAYNDQIIFWLMGGLSLPDPTRPECVQIRDIRGLMAPWRHIEQQGANQHGVTHVDELYEPTEVDIDVVLFARDAKHLRRLRRHLHEALDAKMEIEFGYITPEEGHWWAPVRWRQKFDGSDITPNQCVLAMTLKLQADNAFYQSYPDVAEFGFVYEDCTDTFNEADYTADKNCGPNWPIHYDGDGGGYLYSNGHHARWRDDPDDTFTTRTREAVAGPYKDFETATDNQVVRDVLGSSPEWSAPETGANDLWARMGRNEDGTWDGCGIRLRRGWGRFTLSAFVDGEEIWSRVVRGLTPEHPAVIIPHIGDEWTLAAGYEDDPRMFKVFRNGAEVLKYKEVGTASKLGEGYRGVGFGVRAAGAWVTQATPAIVRKIAAGDNAAVTQSGVLERRNAGDQDAYDSFTLYGPATKFEISNGPFSDDMIEFGPLGPGEIAHIRTDPRRRGVFDYTHITGPEVAPALFGASPTDTMYRRMKGRFTSECAIPRKEPGMRVKTHLIKVGITGGNADSRIVASLTPLRRYPA